MARKARPPQIASGAVTPSQVAFMVDRYLNEHRFLKTLAEFRAEASSFLAPVKIASDEVRSLSAILNEYIILKEERIALLQEKSRVERLCSGLQDVLSLYHSGEAQFLPPSQAAGPIPPTPHQSKEIANTTPAPFTPASMSNAVCDKSNLPITVHNSANKVVSNKRAMLNKSRVLDDSDSNKRTRCDVVPASTGGMASPQLHHVGSLQMQSVDTFQTSLQNPISVSIPHASPSSAIYTKFSSDAHPGTPSPPSLSQKCNRDSVLKVQGSRRSEESGSSISQSGHPLPGQNAKSSSSTDSTRSSAQSPRKVVTCSPPLFAADSRNRNVGRKVGRKCRLLDFTSAISEVSCKDASVSSTQSDSIQFDAADADIGPAYDDMKFDSLLTSESLFEELFKSLDDATFSELLADEPGDISSIVDNVTEPAGSNDAGREIRVESSECMTRSDPCFPGVLAVRDANACEDANHSGSPRKIHGIDPKACCLGQENQPYVSGCA